jgi:MurNAc alpha-1-phosphate uridylyltransferase
MSSEEKVMQCVILAGGLATRMRPLTDTIPKSLITVNGRPFIDYQLQWLQSQGVTEVVLCIGYQGVRIREHLARWPGEMSIRFVDEGEVLRGTGGAIRMAFDAGVLAERFLVTYGDSFLPVSFPDVWASFLKNDDAALMTVFRNQGRWDASNVRYENGRVVLYDKSKSAESRGMDFIDYGLSAFKRSVIETSIGPGEKMDLSLVFHRLSVSGELAGYEVDTRFYEIGSAEGLNDFSKFASTNLPTLMSDVRSMKISPQIERNQTTWRL